MNSGLILYNGYSVLIQDFSADSRFLWPLKVSEDDNKLTEQEKTEKDYAS